MKRRIVGGTGIDDEIVLPGTEINPADNYRAAPPGAAGQAAEAAVTGPGPGQPRTLK
jgi:hypothetical protein